MTREKAIECNKNLRMYMKLSDKNQPCKFLEDNYIALDMAIKALEQEPFMNKPCVAHQVCHEDKVKALDKIRAEITEIVINGQVDEHTAFIRTGEQVKQVALDIIDKYKAESEMQEIEVKSCSNCKYWLLDKNDKNRKCKYCFEMDKWMAESEGEK